MFIDEKDFVSFLTIKKGLSSQSIKHCTIRLNVIQDWMFGRNLTKRLVEEFLSEIFEKNRNNNTFNTYIFTFKQIKDFLVDRGEDGSFFEGFKNLKKHKPQIDPFTREEIEAILNTSLEYGNFRGKDCSFLDINYRTLTMFLALTGCRFEEAGKLRIRELNISAGKVTFVETKNNNNRTNFFTEPLKSRLKKLIDGREPTDYVFTNAVGTRVNAQDYSQDLKKRAVKAGVTKRVFPHNFRHSYATHLLEAGVPITEVATLLGHKDIQTTFGNYMHLADKTLERAARRHPLIRSKLDPKEVLEMAREAIFALNFDSDDRFNFSITQTESRIAVNIKVK